MSEGSDDARIAEAEAAARQIGDALGEMRRHAARIPAVEEKLDALSKSVDTLNQQLNSLIQVIQAFGARG